MKIGYPEKNGSKEDLKFTNSYGKYLISHFNTWHGGIHLEGAKKAIQTIAKGRIIAYRLQEKYEVLKGTQKASKKKYTYSNSFILMQHDLELTKEVQTKEGTDKVEKKQVTFYSLYNHLMPLKEQEKLGLPFPDFISKEELKVIKKERYDSSFKKAGLNGRVLNAAGKVQRGASGVKVIIPYGTIVQKYKDTAGNFVTENSYTRVVYEDETGTIYDDIYIYTKKGKVKKEGEGYRINTKEDFPTDKGARVREAPGKAITAIIPYNETVEIVKKEGNWYRIKGYEGVSHKGNFEKRKILNTKAFTKNAITASDIPVESGVCIGYTGAMHGENTPWYCASQLDVFMTEGVEDFLKNTFGATVTGKNFITLPEGTKLKEKLSVSVKLEKNLPVKIVEIRGNYAKINVPKFVDKIVDKRDLYTPNKSSADGKMRGYNRIRGYHILNFENINKRFDGLLIEGESKLFCHGLRNSKVQRKVKYYPKEGGKKGYWVPLDALSKNVVYEEKEEVREVPKRLNVFEGLLDYIVTQDRTVQKKVKVCKAVKVPIAKNQKVLLNRFIDTAYLEVSKKDEEEELYKEVVVDLRGAKECMVKKKKYLKVRCSYTIGNDSYKQEGWIPAKGLEKKAFNGYHWERFGFELVDGGKEYMYDIKDLREASTTESRFVETMWRKLGVVEDDVLDFFELEAAYALLETQEKISKMVCKHKIEWSYTPEEIAKEVEGFYNYYIGHQRDLGEDTQKLEELKEEKLAAIKEQVSKLMFWKEASALPYGAHKEVRALGADLKMQPLSLLTSSSTEGATCFNVFDSDEEIAKKEALKKQAPKKDSVKKKQVAPARRARSKQDKQPVRKFPNTDMVYHFHPIGFVNHMRLISGEGGNEDCPELVWGKKVSCEFRKRVVQISKRLECDPNHLMTAMALETGGKFDPFIKNKQGYVGLIQIGTDAAADINRRKKTKITTNHLRYMSAELQLKYVEYYLEPHKGKLKTLTDFYLAVLWPKAVGQGGNDNFIVFDDDSKSNYNRKAYRQNKSFLKEEGEITKGKDGKKIYGKAGGKTYVWEIREEIEKWHKDGKNYINNCNDGNCTLIPLNSTCGKCNQKHYDVKDLIHFQSQSKGSSNCGTISRYIIEEISAVSCEGISQKGIAHYQLAIENSSKNGLDFDIEKSKTAIKYLDLALANNLPIRAGVNHTFGGSINEKENPTTDHYVVIVGKKCIEGEVYYQYWDVGTFRGAQEKYRFKLVDGYKLINEDANAGGGKDGRKFTVTQIARATKENRSTLIQLNKKD
ncbi:SH3 domain-containing protein [Tenacibaculum maritimum]|uniref:SH3 domain-containing protein n=1 Tax=Tenacibaculum maritimum TaxID=107401 RepID=UPI003890141F